MGMLEGRVAIITGAGAGIGRGVALACADEGATIVAAGRTRSTLEALCAEVADRGARALPVVCDVRELDDISQCIDRTIAEYGRLDILVNNAQTYRHSFLLDATEEDFDTTWRSGPLAAFRSMRLAHPHLRKNRGVIVNFGSGVQLDSSESFHGVYAAAKNAIEALTRVAAVEWVAAPALLSAPVLLAAETVTVVAIELKLLGELHEVYGRPVPGGTGQRALHLLQSWSQQRGINPLLPGVGVATVLGTAARRDLQRSLLRRFGRSLSTLGPLLTGAAVAGYLNRRATRSLGDHVQKDLRRQPRVIESA